MKEYLKKAVCRYATFSNKEGLVVSTTNKEGLVVSTTNKEQAGSCESLKTKCVFVPLFGFSGDKMPA